VSKQYSQSPLCAVNQTHLCAMNQATAITSQLLMA